jgi:hypothetical protein
VDPFSAILIAIIGAVVLTKSAGGAAADWAATKTGNTPPSHKRWEARQARREARGEKRENISSNFLRRLRMHGEAAAVRAEQKHTARMERLRDNGRANVDKYRRRIEAREAAIGKICKWGGTSLAAIRGIPDSVRERQAHQENQRRDAESEGQIAAARDEAAALPARGGAGGDNVVPLHRPGTSQPDGTPQSGELTEEQQLLVQRIRNHWSQGKPLNFNPEDWWKLPLGVRAELLKTGAAAKLRLDPEFDPEARAQAGLPVEDGIDPRVADLIDDLDQDDPPHDATQHDDTERDGVQIDTPSPEGNLAVSNPTTIEITNLETASTHATESTKWATETATSFDGTQTSLRADAASCEAQATEHENAAASLKHEGFDGDVITHENTMAEQYRLAAASLRQAAQLLTTVTENCNTAADAGGQITRIFTNQQQISESVAANRQAGVANNTNFY